MSIDREIHPATPEYIDNLPPCRFPLSHRIALGVEPADLLREFPALESEDVHYRDLSLATGNLIRHGDWPESNRPILVPNTRIIQ